MTETSIITPELVGVIVTAIIGIVGSNKFVQFQTKFTIFQNVILEINEALKDDTITPQESRKIIGLLRGLVK